MMASKGNALSNVMKKSVELQRKLDIKTGTYKEYAWDWNAAAKDLNRAYADLVQKHDEIGPKIEDDWKDLGQRYQNLASRMQELEQTKIGTEDQERKEYTAKVQKLIEAANQLGKEIEDEPERRLKAALKFQKDFDEAAKKLNESAEYAELNGLVQQPAFKQVAQLKNWLTSPTEKQKGRIVEEVKSIVLAVETHRQQQEEARKLQQLEEQARQRREEEQRLEQERQVKARKEREELEPPVRRLLNEVHKEVENEIKAFKKLSDRIKGCKEEAKKDKRFSIYLQNLNGLEVQIRNDIQSATGKRPKLIQVQAWGLDNLAEGLENLDIRTVITTELQSLTRELNNVSIAVSSLAGKRDGYDSVLTKNDPSLIVKRERDPNVTAFIHQDAMDEASSYTKDMAGVLAGERGGRTSPNGRTNHLHVGGDANLNAIFDWNGEAGAVRLLGFVHGHMERGAPPPVLQEAERVENRAGGTFIKVIVQTVERTITRAVG